MFGTTDWLLKRFLKFVLKRFVGKYLSSEIDLEQLDVKLETGKLELRNLLLNCDAVNKDLALGDWHVKAGYIGNVVAKLPLVSLSSAQCSVVVNEVMLTVAPKPLPSAAINQATTATPAATAADGTIFPQDIAATAPSTSSGAAGGPGGAMGFLLADDFGWTGQGAVMDGIKRIAGSLQSMLQHMRIDASNVLIRLELPHPTESDRVVTAALKLDLVEFGELASQSSSPAAPVPTPATPQQHLSPQSHDQRYASHNHHSNGTGASTQGSQPSANRGSGPRTGGSGRGASDKEAAPCAIGAGAAAATTPGGTGVRREIAKHIQIKGLSLDLFETAPLVTGDATAAAAPAGAASMAAHAAALPASSTGSPAFSLTQRLKSAVASAGVTLVSGPGKHGMQLSVELRMVTHEDPRQHPTQITADINLGAVRVQLLPSHAVCLSALRLALDKSAAPAYGGAAAAAAAASDGGASDAELWASYASGGGVGGGASQWGQRSLFESIMLPNCEGVVAHSLEPYMFGVSYGYGDASEFHDACSRFGSLASSLVSSVTQTSTNFIGYVAASGSAAVGGAMEWMGGSAGGATGVGAGPQSPPPASHYPADSPGAAGGTGHGMYNPQAPPAPGSGAAPVPSRYLGSGAPPLGESAPRQPPSAPPIVNIHAHVSHSALVLCYGPAGHSGSSSSPSGPANADYQQSDPHAQNGNHPHHHNHHHQHTLAAAARKGAAHQGSGGVAGRSAKAAAVAAPSPTSPATSASSAAGGSLVVELHDVGCDVLLDAAHGNRLSLQAGQLQVYEQLPAELGARQGISAAEWSRVPEVLPQAPYRFRPTQPSPAGRNGGTSGAGGGSLAVAAGRVAGSAARAPGRNAQAAHQHAGHGGGSGAAGGFVSGALQNWPILSCASSASQTTATNGPVTPGAGAGSLTAGKAPGSQQATTPGGCLRLRASWGDVGAGGGPAEYGRYGREAPCSAPSYDLALEVLPVTLWLSLPLVERISSFVAPLAAEAGGKGARGVSGGRMATVVHRPPAPLPRLSLSVTAPHVCVLLALLPAGLPADAAPKPPGSPVFLALDIVSTPHPAAEGALAYPSPHPGPAHSAPYSTQHHYSQHQQHRNPYGATFAGPAYDPSLHANGHAGHYAASRGYGSNGGWPNHGSVGHAHDHAPSGPGHVGFHGGAYVLAAGAVAGLVPPLVTLFQTPATDRLIPSQVTTVDVAAGVVELLLVRTAGAAGSTCPQARGHAHAQDAAAHGSSAESAASTAAAGPWSSKLLLSLSPLPMAAPPPTPVGLSAWASPHSAPPTGPADVPPGCGLYLHVCSDPGVGSAPELVPEAWEHVTLHAQDRWGDPDGEGGAWEDRSSFRSLAFHERCRKSSAMFVHLRTPKALVHLTRTDLVDLVTLPATMLPTPSTAPPATQASARAGGGPMARHGSASARASGPAGHSVSTSTPPAQTCALLEVCLTVQLQDDPAVPAPAPAACAGGSGPASTVAVAAAAPGSAAPPGFGAGLGIGGSHVAMYELRLEELTLFRANCLGGPHATCGLLGAGRSGAGADGGCNVTSVHVHGVTLMGHLELPGQQSPQGTGSAPGSAVATGAAAALAKHQHQQPQGPNSQASDGLHRRSPAQPHTLQGYGHRHAGAGAGAVDGQPRQPNGGAPRPGTAAATCPQPPHHGKSICLLHCPLSAGAADKAPSYIEYVCVERQQPTHSGANPTSRAFGQAPALRPATATARGSLPRAASAGDATPAGAAAAAAAVAPAGSAIHSVLLQGLTVSTDHGYVTMDWAAQLGALLASIAPPPPPPPPTTAPAAVTPGPQGSTGSCGSAGAGLQGYLSVNIVDLALRHEPMEYPELPSTATEAATAAKGGPGSAAGGSTNGGGAAGQSPQAAAAAATAGPCPGRVRPVALALIIEAVHFGLPLGAQVQPVEQVPYTPPVHSVVLHSMTLHLASVDARGPGWDAGAPRAVREQLLQACGYHRVLQETLIKVVAKQRRYPCRPKPAAAPSAATLAAVAAATAQTDPQGLLPLPGPEDGPAAATAEAEGVNGACPGALQEFHTTLDVEITNQHLLGMLTVESATLLAHFAIQAGTLMTARQAAAVAAAASAAGAPPRRNAACRAGGGGAGPTDLYWDAASDTGSSAVGGLGPSSGAGAGAGASDSGGEAAESLLTALLLDEVEENAFRLAPAPVGAGGSSTSLSASGVLQAHGAGWYASGGAVDGDVAGSAAADGSGGGGSGGLILIDDFFPVNHQGEYDEDLTLVDYPAELKDGRAGAWRHKAELEGTWYGPNEGPDQRPASRATCCCPTGPGATNPAGPRPVITSAGPRASGTCTGPLVCTGSPRGAPSDPFSSASASAAASLRSYEAYIATQQGLEGSSPDGAGAGGLDGDDSGCLLFDGAPGGGAKVAPVDALSHPDIDDLLAGVFPVAADPRFTGEVVAGAEGPGGRLGAGSGAGGSATAAPSVLSVGSSAATASSTAPTWRLQEDYVRVPRKSDEDGACPVPVPVSVSVGGGLNAMGGPAGTPGAPSSGMGGTGHPADPSTAAGGAPAVSDGAEQPPPLTRITFKDLSGIWVMHTTGSSSSSSSTSAASAAASSPSGQQEGRVELVIEGLGLLLESYGPGGHLARHMKVTIHDLEIRDCALEARQQQQQQHHATAAVAGHTLAAVGSGLASLASVGAAAAAAGGARARAAAAAAGGGASGWIRVLGYRAVRGRPRDSRAPLVAVALTAVRPNPTACDPRDEESRLAVALLPMRLKLNQDIMSYLTWYGTSVSTALKPAAAVLNAMQTALSELGGCEPLPPPYFQWAQIRGFTVMLDYRPRRVDIGALAEGRLTELLNLVPLGGVDLACKPLRLAGLQGWDGLGAAVLREWLTDIARTQAHKFITGLAPVNAVVKVGSAVATLLAAPARHLARREAVAGRQLAAQLRRTSATFATKLVLEAMAAGKKAAAGAGKALARVGSSALGAYGGAAADGDPGEGRYDDQEEEEEEEEGDEAYGGADGPEDGRGGSGRGRSAYGATASGYGSGEEEGPEEDEDGVDEDRDGGDEYGEEVRRGGMHHVASYGGPTSAAAYGGAGPHHAVGGADRMRRSRSASSVVRKGLVRAALSLGSASQQVVQAGLQAGGLQRGVSSVARALTAAAASGVTAAAPASAALQGQLKGTLRSVRQVLGAQLVPQGPAGRKPLPAAAAPASGGAGAAAAAAQSRLTGPGGPRAYPPRPRPKED